MDWLIIAAALSGGALAGGITVAALRKSREPTPLPASQVPPQRAVDRQDHTEAERTELFMQAASDWFWETDSDHRFTYLSDRIKNLMGVDADQYIGKTRIELAADNMSPRQAEEHLRILNAYEPFRDLVYSVKLTNGQTRTLRVSGLPFFAEDGTFLGYRGSAADVTAQQESKIRVERAELRLREAMEAIEDGLVLFDEEDRLELANKRFGELYPVIKDLLEPGIAFPDLWEAAIQRQAYEVDEPDEAQALKNRLEQHYLADGRTNEHRTINGRWIRFNERRIGDGSVVGIWSDVTDLRGQQELAQKQYRLLRGIMTHLPIALVAIGEDGRLITWNNKLFDLFDYPIHLASTETHIEELVRFNVRQGVYGPQSREGESLVRERVAALIGDEQLTERWSLPNGKVVELNSTPLDGGGRVLTLTDVTAFQEAEDVLSRANQVKTAFITHLSHELRTPLNSVLGLCDLLMDCEIDARAGLFVSQVARAAESLLHSISSIASLARLENLSLDERTDPIDVGELLSQVCHDARSLVDPTRVSVSQALDGHIRSGLIGHAQALTDILQNLAANAADRTSNGRIVLGATTSRLSDEMTLLRLTVRDDGPPLSKAERRVIGERPQAMERADQPAIGLLLSVAMRLVDALGGKMVAEPSNTGGMIRVDVPLRSEAERAASDSNLNGRRIALLATDLARAAVLAERLSSRGAEILSAPNGTALITKIVQAEASGQRCDAVVLDSRPNPMDAMGLAERMRREPKLGNLHLVGLDMSGVEAEDLFDALVRSEAGINAFEAALVPISPFGPDPISLTAPGSDAGPSASHPADPAHLSILLVEDNQVNQLVAVGMLQKRGHRVRVAENGMEALEAVEQEEFDIILMDIQMPRMDGMEATTRIRQMSGRPSKTPIVAVTANAMPGDAERYLAAGMNDYVPKPIDKASLFSAIERWTGATETVKTPALPVPQEATAAPPAPDPQEDATVSAPAPQSDVSFDFSTLKAMEGELGYDTIVALVGSYLNDAALRREGLVKALADSDRALLEREAHTLKGMAGNLGIMPVFELAKIIVVAVRSEALDDALARTPELISVIDAAEIAIRDAYKEAKGAAE